MQTVFCFVLAVNRIYGYKSTGLFFTLDLIVVEVSLIAAKKSNDNLRDSLRVGYKIDP